MLSFINRKLKTSLVKIGLGEYVGDLVIKNKVNIL